MQFIWDLNRDLRPIFYSESFVCKNDTQRQKEAV